MGCRDELGVLLDRAMIWVGAIPLWLPSVRGLLCIHNLLLVQIAWGSPPKSPILGDFKLKLLVSKSPNFGGFRGLKPTQTKRQSTCVYTTAVRGRGWRWQWTQQCQVPIGLKQCRHRRAFPVWRRANLRQHKDWQDCCSRQDSRPRSAHPRPA